MSSRKSSFDEYNATCDSTNVSHDLNRAILMSFSDTLSSTQRDSTGDLLSSTILSVNCSSDVESTIAEKTFTLPVKRCTPKIIGDEILIDHYAVPREPTFASRIPKYNDAKSTQPVGLSDDKESKQPVGLSDDAKSNEVQVKKYYYDVENIRQSNLWPALTALETSLHASDEQTSTPDDADILKKLDEEFSSSPRQFTATLMTIIEESFGELEEGNGDVSRFGLMELLKKTASSGQRLEDESPPAFMFSCFSRSKQTDHEAKSDSFEPDCENSNERFISLPSESQALANESPQSSYMSFETLTITTGTERISTNEPKKYVNTAKITVHPDTPTKSTSWVSNCRENRTQGETMPRSPLSRPKRNAVRLEGIADESPQLYSSFEALTLTTATASISTKEPKRYPKTPEITVDPGTPSNATNRAANCRVKRSPVRRMLKSPISRPKTNAVSFEDIEDESPQSTYSSLETLRMTTSAERISTKEPKKYPKTPKITVDPVTPTNATSKAANCRLKRSPARRILKSPISRPKTNAVSFEAIEDESSQSTYSSLEALRMTTDAGRISTKEPKKYPKTPRITVDPGTPINATYRATDCQRNRTPVKRMLRSPVSRPKINAPSFEGIAEHGRESPNLSPLSNNDDDEYLTAESETEAVSDTSENTKTDGSLEKKLNMSTIASHHRKWVTTFEQHAKYTCNTSLRATERKRKLSSHTNKLEMRWLKKLTEKRQKCFDLVEEMMQKSVSDPSEPKVKSPCSCSPCKLSKEFCSVLSAFQEYMQYAMHAPEVTKKDDNHRFVTSVKMNLKTKNSKSPRGALKSTSTQRKSLNKMHSPRFLSSRVKSNTLSRNRGVSPKKTRGTCVDTSSIRSVSQLRRVFSPRPGTAGCSESKNLGAKQTMPRKIPSSIGTETTGRMVFLPGHGPIHYKKVVSPVGEYIRGKKAT